MDSIYAITTKYAGEHRHNRLVALIFVCGLHATLFVAFRLAITRAHPASAVPEPVLVFMWLPAPPVPLSAPKSQLLWRTRAATRAEPPALTAPANAAAVTQIGGSTSTKNAVDWSAEATRSAAAQVARVAAPTAAPSRHVKAFQWDSTVTQRVELISGGGTLIRLNDHCSLVIAPLPLIGCWFGRREANAHLFDEMNSASRTDQY